MTDGINYNKKGDRMIISDEPEIIENSVRAAISRNSVQEKKQNQRQKDSIMEEETKNSIIDAIHLLGEEIISINKSNGWNVTTPDDWAKSFQVNPYRVYKIPTVLALIHSEVSEALEAFRSKDKENFTEELADTLIRVLDCTQGLGIDLGAAVLDKLEKNRSRGYRHGGKTV